MEETFSLDALCSVAHGAPEHQTTWVSCSTDFGTKWRFELNNSPSHKKNSNFAIWSFLLISSELEKKPLWAKQNLHPLKLPFLIFRTFGENCSWWWCVSSSEHVKALSLSPCAQGAMCCISCSHTLPLLLCVLILTPTATGAGPETLCGAELVDTLQFVCGERGFYFSKCTFLFIHKGCPHVSQSSPPPAGS